jgi:hypothetical protein
MTVEQFIRLLAGTMVMISLVLYHLLSPYWLLLTAFVAANLIQSAFTGFCLPEILFKKWFFDKPAQQTRSINRN